MAGQFLQRIVPEFGIGRHGIPSSGAREKSERGMEERSDW